jgi:hypothetical protein
MPWRRQVGLDDNFSCVVCRYIQPSPGRRCQEEIYLEETEEELRAILVLEDPSSYNQGTTACVDCCFVTESLDEERGRAAEELITGDSDDPPLSATAVVEMLSLSRFYRSRSL